MISCLSYNTYNQVIEPMNEATQSVRGAYEFCVITYTKQFPSLPYEAGRNHRNTAQEPFLDGD